jgi:hypothetical protein
MSSGAPDRISDWFTEDFRLHEPGKPALPVGHEGARQMMEAGRQNRMRAGVQSPAKVEILDMIQEGDRVAVRWQVTATAHDGDPYEGSLQSIALRPHSPGTPEIKLDFPVPVQRGGGEDCTGL